MRIGTADTADRHAVIAEIGNNHEGDVETAIALVEAAAKAGAHAVKLQVIEPRALVRPTETARIAQLERFRLEPGEVRRVHDAAREQALGFVCTPFHLDAIGWLTPLVDAFKIASGDNDVPALLDAVGATGKPAIFSTGMSDDATVAAAHDRLRAAGAAEVGILHCVSAYPTPPADAHLASIPDLAARFPDAVVGYSDHTLGIDACAVAVGLGARLIEKHVTLRHDFSDFRDHQLSAEPDELAELVRRCDVAAALRGEPKHGVLPVEQATAAAARRSVVAARDLPEGHLIAAADLTWLRPRDGVAPSAEGELLGRRLRRPLAAGEPVVFEVLDGA